jgi:S-formylglutathione hydrolase FrmB
MDRFIPFSRCGWIWDLCWSAQRSISSSERFWCPLRGHRNRSFINWTIPSFFAALAALVVARSVQAQLLNRVNLDRVNCRLAGHVIDYTNNHGCDRRIESSILGMRRDLYVYLPPGYDPGSAYPLILFFHMANVDEHYFIGSELLNIVDNLILRGEFPSAIIACPDGMYGGTNGFRARHSLYINGRGGRFEDHILQEVLPFLFANYSIRPEREAHALLAASAGGYGAMSLAVDHRDFFGAIATLAAPLNLRYSNCDGIYFENFNPATYRWKTRYAPHEVIGISRFGLLRFHAQRFMTPVFGEGEAAVAWITRTNPADKLSSANLQPGQLDIYVNYPGRDNFNFDAQDESFQWLAASRGVDVTLVRDPEATHSLRYLRANLRPAFIWLGQHLLPPATRSAPVPGQAPVAAGR